MANLQFSFSGKTALVTGGAQGIGLEIARRFLQSEAQVVIWDYSESSLEKAQATLSSYASRLSLDVVDVGSLESCSKASTRLSSPVDILVNNAGIVRDKSFKKMSEEDFDQVIRVNLKGVFNSTHALLEKFNPESQQRRIVNISSVVGLYGNFGQTNYAAAKAGVVGMTKTWAKELGRKGFCVNAIAPGFIKTQMTAGMPEEVLSAIEKNISRGRMGEVAEIANTVLFLASEEASYINGTVVTVDGGTAL